MKLEARADLVAWELFIAGFNGKHVLLSDVRVASDVLCLYTDAVSIKGFAECLETSGLSILGQLKSPIYILIF